MPTDLERDPLMTERTDLVELLRRETVLAIVRLRRAQPLSEIVRAMARGGLKLAEITIDTPGALEAIRELSAQDLGLTLGVGTVTTPAQVQDAAGAGARFIVTPGVVAAVLEEATAAGLGVICGALTPSEILAAHQQGAEVIKLFPASSLGPDYLKQVRAPLKDIPLLAVGGIDAANAGAYLQAGAIGVALGSALVSDSMIEAHGTSPLKAHTEALLEKIRKECT